MTHSTANQATLSKLSASQADSTQANSGSCNNDMSEKQNQSDVFFLIAVSFFSFVIGCFVLLLFFINSDSMLGFICAAVSAFFLLPPAVVIYLIKFKK